MNIRTFPSIVATVLLLVLGSGAAMAQPLQDFIATAESAFGGRAFVAERYNRYVEVQLLSGNQLIEAEYDRITGQLVDSDAFGSPRRVQRVTARLNRATLSLGDAIDAAQRAVGSGEVLEAELRVSGRNRGRRFIVEIRTNAGVYDVIVASATGRIIRVLRD
ncbi:PepSY domain-containing protein [Methylotetracoccus oryzae]|uniref:PepSY domain-containing protein n=1 Tax=Methylotetracoccus oryzae TaxID=1919059 RepID=UPI00111847E6|nr:PepSY domain-containing protein [Methylotetracoccus oryzae]